MGLGYTNKNFIEITMYIFRVKYIQTSINDFSVYFCEECDGEYISNNEQDYQALSRTVKLVN